MIANREPKAKPLAQRQAALMEALRAYGVFDEGSEGPDGAPDFLAAQFVMAWLECWRARRWEMMGHYIEQAQAGLFDNMFGRGLNNSPTAGPAENESPTCNIGDIDGGADDR